MKMLIALLLATTLTGCSCRCQRFMPTSDGGVLDTKTGQLCDARPDRLQGHILPSCHDLYTGKVK